MDGTRLQEVSIFILLSRTISLLILIFSIAWHPHLWIESTVFSFIPLPLHLQYHNQ
jgi:hypothetical protein